MADEYDAFIKAAQQAIKAQGAEHKQQFNNYLDEYNQTAKTPVRDETAKYKVNTGSKGGFGTNYIAQSGVANGASKPPRNSKTTPPSQSTGSTADVSPITGNKNADENYARVSDAYEKYKAGDIDATTFQVMTGTTPEIWEQTSGRLKQDANDYRTQQIVDNRTRQTMNTLPDEERHMFQAQLEDNWVNPAREDFSMDAAKAAIQAQQKGMAQQKRYEDLMARYNTAKPEAIPNLYDEPIGPPAPVATQNYGYYYDNRSGNSPYTRYDEPVGPPAPSADPNSPVSTYQQNQNAGVAGFSGNPQTNPEAAALLQEYDNRMAAHNSWVRPDPRTIYQDAAHGGMTPDQRNASIYDQLKKNGMSKSEILEWAQSEAENYMSPEEAMRFYFYVDNH